MKKSREELKKERDEVWLQLPCLPRVRSLEMAQNGGGTFTIYPIL